MDNNEVIAAIKQYLRHRYANYLNKAFTNRLILSERHELLTNLENINAQRLDDVLELMKEKGYIIEDTGILITFSPAFLMQN